MSSLIEQIVRRRRASASRRLGPQAQIPPIARPPSSNGFGAHESHPPAVPAPPAVAPAPPAIGPAGETAASNGSRPEEMPLGDRAETIVWNPRARAGAVEPPAAAFEPPTEPEPTAAWTEPEPPEPEPEPESAWLAAPPQPEPELDRTLEPATSWLPVSLYTPAPEPHDAAAANAIEDTEPTPDPEPTPEPGIVERGRIRRRARYLRRLREVQLRDIGGFVVELHRFGCNRPDLVRLKVEGAERTGAELRALERAVGPGSSIRELREAGIGGACDTCGAVHGSEDRYCASCGEPLQPELYAPDEARGPGMGGVA